MLRRPFLPQVGLHPPPGQRWQQRRGRGSDACPNTPIHPQNTFNRAIGLCTQCLTGLQETYSWTTKRLDSLTKDCTQRVIYTGLYGCPFSDLKWRPLYTFTNGCPFQREPVLSPAKSCDEWSVLMALLGEIKPEYVETGDSLGAFSQSGPQGNQICLFGLSLNSHAQSKAFTCRRWTHCDNWL